jgi:hypothetical protein
MAHNQEHESLQDHLLRKHRDHIDGARRRAARFYPETLERTVDEWVQTAPAEALEAWHGEAHDPELRQA